MSATHVQGGQGEFPARPAVGLVADGHAPRGIDGDVEGAAPVGLVEDFVFTHILSFSEDSITAVTGERPARTFSLDPDRWLDRACAIAGRDLTEAEWTSHLPDRPYRRTCSDRA